MITARAFAGKHYAVLGLARSGLATVEALLASGAKVTAWDDKGRGEGQGAVLAWQLEDFVGERPFALQFNRRHARPATQPPPDRRGARSDAGVEIIGDIELFARARPELPPHKVVGITGTNGKSTTTALIHHILKTAGVPTEMGGNIGLPILAQDPLPEGGVYVLELSSYQIDLTKASIATSRCCSTSRPIIWIGMRVSRPMRRRRPGCSKCSRPASSQSSIIALRSTKMSSSMLKIRSSSSSTMLKLAISRHGRRSKAHIIVKMQRLPLQPAAHWG